MLPESNTGLYRVKADLQEVGCGGVDWTELAKDKR